MFERILYEVDKKIYIYIEREREREIVKQTTGIRNKKYEVIRNVM